MNARRRIGAPEGSGGGDLFALLGEGVGLRVGSGGLGGTGPIRRGEYLIGKYLGTLLTIAVFVLADAGLLLLISAVLGGRSAGVVLGAGAAAAAALAVAAWRSSWARTFGLIPWSLALLALGQTFVIAAGLIDLSVGQLMGLVTILASDFMRGEPGLALPALALALATGTAVGLANALFELGPPFAAWVPRLPGRCGADSEAGSRATGHCNSRR